MSNEGLSFEESLKRLTQEIPTLRKDLQADGKERDELNQTIKKLATKYLILALILPPIITGGAGYFAGKKWGKAEGFNLAYTLAKDEKAAASWANSGDGLKAYEMDKNGTLSQIVHCTGKSWEIKIINGRTACFTNGSGWYLP